MPSRKKNIYLIGPMGAGKSTIGRELAKKLVLDFYDTDQEIERRCGVDIGWIYDVEGPAKFREREKKVILDLTEAQGVVLATGGGSILDEASRNRLASRGTVIYLTVSLSQQLKRTEKDKRRPLVQNSDNLERDLAKMSELRERMYKEIADITVATDARTVRAVSNTIIKELQKSKL